MAKKAQKSKVDTIYITTADGKELFIQGETAKQKIPLLLQTLKMYERVATLNPPPLRDC